MGVSSRRPLLKHVYPFPARRTPFLLRDLPQGTGKPGPDSAEAIARDWIVQHQEYADQLASLDEALAADYSVERGVANPFLHLSMHLSIAEQISIDQPPGIRGAFLALARRLGSEHDAHHEMMECLGEMIWQSQRSGLPPDGVAFIECVKRRAS